MILVTGATGDIGHQVAVQLAATHVPTRALYRNPAKLARLNASPGLEWVWGDFEIPATLDAAMAGVDRVFLVSTRGPRQLRQEVNVLEAALRAGVQRIVKVSGFSGVIRSDSPDPVGRWHWEIEQKIAASGIDYAFLRPNAFMQNMLLQAKLIAKFGVFCSPFGRSRCAMVDTRDIAAVATGALLHEGCECTAYDVTGPESLSSQDVAAMLFTVTGKPVRQLAVPGSLFNVLTACAGLPAWHRTHNAVIAELFRAGEGETVSDAVAMVGRLNPTGFMEFAKRHAFAFGAAT